MVRMKRKSWQGIVNKNSTSWRVLLGTLIYMHDCRNKNTRNGMENNLFLGDQMEKESFIKKSGKKLRRRKKI